MYNIRADTIRLPMCRMHTSFSTYMTYTHIKLTYDNSVEGRFPSTRERLVRVMQVRFFFSKVAHESLNDSLSLFPPSPFNRRSSEGLKRCANLRGVVGRALPSSQHGHVPHSSPSGPGQHPARSGPLIRRHMKKF